MPFTLAQLQTELQNHGYGTDTTAAQTAAINAGLRDLRNYRKWPWDEGDYTITMNAGTVESVGFAFGEPLDAHLIQVGTNNTYDLNHVEWDDLLDLYYQDTTYRAQPEVWSYFEGALRLWPVPDVNYQVFLGLSGVAVELVNPSDLVNLPNNYIQPVIWAALKHLAFRERDWSAFDEADRQFNQSIVRISARLGMETVETDAIPRSGFFDTYDGPVGII